MSMHDGATSDVIYLVRCALSGTAPKEARVAAMDLDAVYEASQRHLLVSACATALEAAGVRDARFMQARAKAMRKVALMNAERANLFQRMDVAGIWHAPLKGCVLQGLYPSFGMRQMADNDVLFDASRADDVRGIMEEMGFTCESFGRGNHDVYHKKPVCNFELHRSLFAPTYEGKAYTYYCDPLRLLVPSGNGGCEMRFSNEDFYVYMIAHECKHFLGGGTGLRSLADTYVWLMRKGQELDWEYVLRQLRELNMEDFEERNRELALALFSGTEPTPDGLRMLAYMADSGAYGTVAHSMANQVARYGRLGYLVRRAFPPLGTMATLCPVLDHVPVLLPVCWAWRIALALATKPRRVAYQLRAAFK